MVQKHHCSSAALGARYSLKRKGKPPVRGGRKATGLVEFAGPPNSQRAHCSSPRDPASPGARGTPCVTPGGVGRTRPSWRSSDWSALSPRVSPSGSSAGVDAGAAVRTAGYSGGPDDGRRPERWLLDGQRSGRDLAPRRSPGPGVAGAVGALAGPTHRRHGPHPGRQRLLARGLRRGHLQLRRRHVLRLRRRHAPEPAHRRDGRHARRPGLLARRHRRRDLQLRRRHLLRLHGGHPPQPVHRRRGRDARRARLLARRHRRRDLQLRRRHLLRLHGSHPPQRAHRRHGTHRRRPRLLARRRRRRDLHVR